MKSLLSIAEKAEGLLHKAFSMKGDEFGFELPSAMLVGVNLDENGDFLGIEPEVASHADIYELLDNVSLESIAGFQVFGLVTCGWAAPISQGEDEPEGAPSEHPDRRRVRLFICADRSEMASVLRFRDEATEPVLDAGEARGPLALAIQNLLARAEANSN